MTTEETQAEVLALMEHAWPVANAVYRCQLSGRFGLVCPFLEQIGCGLFVKVRWCKRKGSGFVFDGTQSEFLNTYFMVDFKLVACWHPDLVTEAWK